MNTILGIRSVGGEERSLVWRGDEADKLGSLDGNCHSVRDLGKEDTDKVYMRRLFSVDCGKRVK